jgi:hypothetical protein
MADTDDVTAAQMFLQRRLEMIWNGQLWRAALVEATLTVNTDGSCNLADTIWIPARGTLLLPRAMQTVLAVRSDKHPVSVASLEGYYRDVTDHLDMQGDPTEFQVLRPVVMEFATAEPGCLQCANAGDAGAAVNLAFSPDGVSLSTATVNPSSSQLGTLFGTVLQIFSLSKGATTGGLSVQAVNAAEGESNPSALVVQVSGEATTAANGFYWSNSAAGPFVNLANPQWVLSYQQVDNGWDLQLQGQAAIDTFLQAGQGSPLGLTGVNGGSVSAVGVDVPVSIGAAAGAAPVHQRIRLTSLPNADVNLRVLGKLACPILGAYDVSPINNSEPCLMAFARADMLMRSRQHGKAAQAMQEGAALLSQLAALEAFHQSNRMQIQPESGYGEPNWDIYAPHL